jgi:hypothetical protein
MNSRVRRFFTQHEFPGGGITSGRGDEKKLGLSRIGEKHSLPCRLADAETKRHPNPSVEVLEAAKHSGHRVAGAVVVLDIRLPGVDDSARVARAVPARMAHSDIKFGEAGLRMP